MSSELEILLASMVACGQRVQKLGYSLNKNRALFPMTPQNISTLSDDQEESIDALILRNSQPQPAGRAKPARVRGLVEEWAELHQHDLPAMWNSKEFHKLTPLV